MARSRERDRVAHVQPVDHHVDRVAVCAVGEVQLLVAVERVEVAVGDVALVGRAASVSGRRLDLTEPKSRSWPTRVRGGSSGVSIRIARPPSSRSTMLAPGGQIDQPAGLIQHLRGFVGHRAARTVTPGVGPRALGFAAMGLSAAERNRVRERSPSGARSWWRWPRDLIGFDTTAREVGDPPRQEAALQHHLADRLRRGRGGDRPVRARRRCAGRRAAGAPRTRFRGPSPVDRHPPGTAVPAQPAVQRPHRRRLGRAARTTGPATRSRPRSATAGSTDAGRAT